MFSFKWCTYLKCLFIEAEVFSVKQIARSSNNIKSKLVSRNFSENSNFTSSSTRYCVFTYSPKIISLYLAVQWLLWMPEDLVRSQKIDSLDLVVVASEFSPRRVEMIVSASPWRMRVYFWQVDFCHTRKLTGPLYECFCVSFSPMPQCLCFCIAFPFEYQSLRSCEESLHHLE